MVQHLFPLDVPLQPLPLLLDLPELGHTHLHTLDHTRNFNHLLEFEFQQNVLGVESQLLFLLITFVSQH